MTLLTLLDVPGMLRPEAARLYQQIRPVAQQDEQYGFTAAHLCAALMAPIERVVQVALDQGERPGYSRMMNVDEADVEDLPWLGQFNGTPLSGTEPEEEQRRLIREARGSHRGTTRAIYSDIQATLTGEKHVRVIERAGAPLKNILVTRPSQTPNPAATLAAATDRATKPLGATYKHIVTSTWIIAEAELFYKGQTVADAEADFTTVHEAETHGVI